MNKGGSCLARSILYTAVNTPTVFANREVKIFFTVNGKRRWDTLSRDVHFQVMDNNAS